MAIQNLGAMRQFQRGNSPTPAMGGRREASSTTFRCPRRARRAAARTAHPTQQPHQQQQGPGAA